MIGRITIMNISAIIITMRKRPVNGEVPKLLYFALLSLAIIA